MAPLPMVVTVGIVCLCVSLQQRRHSQVKRWTKHVDLFSKDFIIIPINEEYVICISFLQRVSIACYAERCISYSKSVRLSVCPSIRLSHAGTESKRLKLQSWGLH